MVIGYNWNDLATTKRFKGKDWLADKMGSTSLGSDAKGKEIDATRVELKHVGGYTEDEVDSLYIPVDFSKYCRGYKKEGHAIYYYMQNDKSFSEFVSVLFE